MNGHLPATETAFPYAPLSRPLLWIPLDELRQGWANFGAEALSAPALLATGSAFRALCWETSALRYYGLAQQTRERGERFGQAAARWLEGVVLDLSEALREWQSALLWLERLAVSRNTQQNSTEPSEQVRALSEQVAAQQQRLGQLLEQVRQECARAAEAITAAGAHQGKEMPWPNA